jgi:D-3-phosphoglycerate dehydrogenase / 2-oxoglutarate reductase
MTRVFVSHPADKLAYYFGDKAVAALANVADAKYNPEPRELTTPELVAAAQGCQALIAYRQTPGPVQLFQGLPELAAFVRCAIDVRTVDIAAASAHGVLVTQASAGFVPAVSEWVIAAMVDLGRGMSRYAEAYHRNAIIAPTMGLQLRGATLGVIGYGQISRYLCDAALALGMQVLVADPHAKPVRPELRHVDLHALLAQSQFVVCLCVANAQTENLMDATAFATMRPGSFFINASRGDTVDEAALLAALESGHLAGCAMDVGRAPDQMPSLVLARHPRVLATPHVGGLTSEAVEHQALETVAQIAALVAGRIPPGALNAEHATRLRHWGRDVPVAPV